MKSLGDRVAERERRNELLREMGNPKATTLEAKGYYWKPLPGNPDEGLWTTPESEARSALLSSLAPEELKNLFKEKRRRVIETGGDEWGLVTRADESNSATGVRYDLYEDVYQT